MNWDAAIQDITDKLVTWDDLSPKMQKLLAKFHEREQQGLKNYRSRWGNTYGALERRGLVQDNSEVTYGWGGGQCVEYNFGLTDMGNRLMSQAPAGCTRAARHDTAATERE